MATITVTDSDLKEIKSALGYPVVCELDWNGISDVSGVNGDDEYICSYVLPRVMRTYFTYFPKLTDQDYTVHEQFSIDYPTDTTYFKAFQWFFNYKKEFQGTYTNPWVLQSQVLYRGSFPMDSFTRPGNVQEMFSRESTAESITNYHKIERITDVMHERKLVGYCSVQSNLMVRWAQYTEDFSDIPYHFKDDALKLAKGYLRQDAYVLRESAKMTGGRIEINSDSFINSANQWVEEVETSWKQRGFAVVSVS